MTKMGSNRLSFPGTEPPLWTRSLRLTSLCSVYFRLHRRGGGLLRQDAAGAWAPVEIGTRPSTSSLS